MDYFLLSTMGFIDDLDNCLMGGPPDELGMHNYRLAVGLPVGELVPYRPECHLDEDHPGIVLNSLLGNTDSFLAVGSAMKNVIVEQCREQPVETLPFDLYDHRGRLYSQDYSFVNPLGGLDCVHSGASGVGSDGELPSIEQCVLDSRKLGAAPPLFRIDLALSYYVVSEQLVDRLHNDGATNLALTQLRVEP